MCLIALCAWFFKRIGLYLFSDKESLSFMKCAVLMNKWVLSLETATHYKIIRENLAETREFFSPAIFLYIQRRFIMSYWFV